MPGCAITQGYAIDCNKDSIGGLREAWVINVQDVLSYTELNGVITAMVLATGKKFYHIDLVKNTSNYATVPTASVENGTFFWAESLTLIFNKIRKAMVDTVQQLAKTGCMFIVKDGNGEYIVLGKEGGLDVSGGSGGSGTAAGDRNGFELQFTGSEAGITFIDPTILPTITA